MKYQILQLKDITKCPYAFLDFEDAKKNGFDLQDYEVLYEGEVILENNETHNDVLEMLFCDFNCGVHKDFQGHSLSVSDIVQLTEDKDSKFYYCDPLGWTELS